ncbi:hypothetical protein BD410DRAFT_85398 [Rickenella mellea]|uniref:Uncharacterized protein n=1 Tax=Rickenella mellea TaxID=50990 RepID=A0A4Y7PLV8_9AGAM|nr:hypothetical protein BD410DRAFT_85398 [Rickenella mellea]
MFEAQPPASPVGVASMLHSNSQRRTHRANLWSNILRLCVIHVPSCHNKDKARKALDEELTCHALSYAVIPCWSYLLRGPRIFDLIIVPISFQPAADCCTVMIKILKHLPGLSKSYTFRVLDQIIFKNDMPKQQYFRHEKAFL